MKIALRVTRVIQTLVSLSMPVLHLLSIEKWVGESGFSPFTSHLTPSPRSVQVLICSGADDYSGLLENFIWLHSIKGRGRKNVDDPTQPDKGPAPQIASSFQISNVTPSYLNRLFLMSLMICTPLGGDEMLRGKCRFPGVLMLLEFINGSPLLLK